MVSFTCELPTCRTEKDAKADEAYFDSYGYFDIHRTMLGDEVRHHSLCCMPNPQSTARGADGVPAGVYFLWPDVHRHVVAACPLDSERVRSSKSPAEGQTVLPAVLIKLKGVATAAGEDRGLPESARAEPLSPERRKAA